MLNVVKLQGRALGRFIYAQMMEHFYYEASEYEKSVVYGYTPIKGHNYSKVTSDKIYDYTVTITPTSAIPEKIFTGFKKAWHDLYKFDSKTEKDLAIILESDRDVLKWLRPAVNQFHIYWNNNSARYQPDFVVETSNTIFMMETKKSSVWILGLCRRKRELHCIIANMQRNLLPQTAGSRGSTY